MLNVDMLSDAGFDVVEAENGDEALRLLQHVADIQFVFTDVDMPGVLDGFALAKQICRSWPKIGVMVTSGRRYPDMSLDPQTRFVPKPFAMSEIVGYIGQYVQASH